MGCRDVMRIRWLFLLCTASPSIHAQPSAVRSFIRINQLGYLPDAPRERAVAAYRLGRKHPGVCQTVPGGQPYFYEEDNWQDDMELGAASLLTPPDNSAISVTRSPTHELSR
jgi:hypothetical protein